MKEQLKKLLHDDLDGQITREVLHERIEEQTTALLRENRQSARGIHNDVLFWLHATAHIDCDPEEAYTDGELKRLSDALEGKAYLAHSCFLHKISAKELNDEQRTILSLAESFISQGCTLDKGQKEALRGIIGKFGPHPEFYDPQTVEETLAVRLAYLLDTAASEQHLRALRLEKSDLCEKVRYVTDMLAGRIPVYCTVTPTGAFPL